VQKRYRLSILLLVTLPVLAHASDSRKHIGSGIGSYYSSEFAGKRTANGERFNPSGFTAAHRSLAFNSRVAVTNMANGRQVTVRINDRGPWSKGRIIDISHAAAKVIGMHRSGTARVKLELLD
jgi:rare lipoprotein A